MAATGTPTTNIGLRRPQGTDPASVDDINYNSLRLDNVIGAVGSQSIAAQISALKSDVGSLVGQKALIGSVSSNSVTLEFGTNSRRYLIIGMSGYASQSFALIVIVGASGQVSILEIAKGASVTLDTSVSNQLGVSYVTSTVSNVLIFAVSQASADVVTMS